MHRARREPLTERVRLDGSIVGVGFASGDRFVVGLWDSGPLGPMVDVMWARPDNERVLLAPDAAVASFVGGLYSFERIEIVEIVETHSCDRLQLSAGPLSLHVRAGDPSLLFRLRPRILRRSPVWARVEDAVFRPLVGRLVLKGAPDTRVYGVGPSGRKQWYCIDSYRPVVSAAASLDGRDLGSLAPLRPRVAFGFSDFPEQPAFVRCAPVMEAEVRAA